MSGGAARAWHTGAEPARFMPDGKVAQQGLPLRVIAWVACKAA